MTIIGIDPGKTGAIAVLRDEAAVLSSGNDAVDVLDMPPTPRDLWCGLGDWAQLWVYPARVYVERQQAMPRQGVTSTFATGYGYGVIIGVLASLGVPYVEVSPSVWKRAHGLIGKDKEASRALAQRWWPDAPLSRKLDHGRAEALLIAEYGRRQEGRCHDE